MRIGIGYVLFRADRKQVFSTAEHSQYIRLAIDVAFSGKELKEGR